MRNFLMVAICLTLAFPLTAADGGQSTDTSKQISFDGVKDFGELIKRGWTTTLSEKQAYRQDGASVELENGNTLHLFSEKPIVVNVSSEMIKVPENAALKISGKIRVENVILGDKGWYKARICIMPYDKTGATIKGGGKSLISKLGTEDWFSFEKTYVIPPGTCGVRVGFELKNCTGSVWFRDMALACSGEMPKIADLLADIDEDRSEPNVIPHPEMTVYAEGTLSLGDVATVFDDSCDSIIKAAVSDFMKENAINSSGSKTPVIRLVIGSPADKTTGDLLASLGFSGKMKDLGEQGYLLFAGMKDGQDILILASSGNPGRFYALQTLKQLIHYENGVLTVRRCLITDKPAYDKRGIVFGGLERWFKGPPVIDEKTGKRIWKGWSYRDRAAALKMNFVWLAGPPTRNCFVTPFPDGIKDGLKKFLADCEKIYVTPSVGISPYRQNPRPEREKGGIIYSSEKDIEGATENLICLYNLGFRNLYMAFDDLPPYRWLEYEEDKAKFKSIGEAHVFYISAVYNRLKEKCPDAILRVIGTAYGGGKDISDTWKEYCRDIACLPNDIEFIWTSLDSPGSDYFKELSGNKKVIVWSNYFASLYEKLSRVPTFSYPYAAASDLHERTTGHFFLMCDLPNEDASHVSWYTAADYMWNPAEYNMSDSFRHAVAKSVAGDVGGVKKYMDLLHSYQKNNGMPGDSGTEKEKAVNQLRTDLEACLSNLKKNVDKDILESLRKENEGIEKELDILLEQYKSKPLPITVQKTDLPPVINGQMDGDKCWSSAEKITDFLVLGKNIPAEVQTTVRLSYDKDNLYVLAIMDEPYPERIAAKFSKRDQEIFIDDCFEIFFGSRKNLKDYYHIAINSRGAVYDQNRLAGDCRKWDGNYQIAVAKKKNAWILEMAIPWNNFGELARESLFTCNFARERYAEKKQVTTYAPLFGSGFHLPQWFWLMKLEDSDPKK